MIILRNAASGNIGEQKHPANNQTPTSIERRPGKRRAAALVEFAITAPLFFVMVLGIIEMGRAVMVTHLLNNAARRGCRVGIVPGTSTTTITNSVYGNLANVGISGDTATVLVNEGATDASAAKSGDEITVKVVVPMKSISWLPSVQFIPGNLQGQSTLRRE